METFDTPLFISNHWLTPRLKSGSIEVKLALTVHCRPLGIFNWNVYPANVGIHSGVRHLQRKHKLKLRVKEASLLGDTVKHKHNKHEYKNRKPWLLLMIMSLLIQFRGITGKPQGSFVLLVKLKKTYLFIKLLLEPILVTVVFFSFDANVF